MNFFNNKTAALITAAALTVSGSAFAAVTDNTDGKGVTISGSTGEANVPIAIEVYSKGKKATDLKNLTEAERLKILICYDGGMTDENGNYSFTFDISQGSGEYTAYAATEKNALTAEDFVFVSNTDFEDMIEDLNDAADKKAVEGLIKTKTYEMGLKTEDIDGVNVSELAEIILNQKNETAFDKTDRTKAHNIIQTALYVQKLNEGKISNIYDEDIKFTLLNSSDIKDWYGKSYVTLNLKSDFTARMSNRGFKSITAYTDALAEAFALATVRYPNGNGNVQDIVTDFASEIGVSGIAIKNSVWAEIAGENFSDYSALASKIKSLNSTSSSGGSSGSGGGSSYSSLRDSTVTGLEKEPVPETIPDEIYSDLDGYDWAVDSVVALTEKGIISGDGNGTFRPADSITREEFCKLVVSAFGLTADSATAGFNDVDSGDWYADSVAIAAANGVVNGVADGVFGVGQSITREDMAVMLYRAYTKTVAEMTKTTDFEFDDDNSIADYAKEAVYAMKAAGVINGIDGANFAPKDTARRAEAAKMIYALIQD